VTESICPSYHKADPDRPRPSAPGVRLCHGHRNALDSNIRELPNLHATLAQHLISSEGGEGAGIPVGITLNPAVVAARDHIRATLTSWALITLEEGPWRIQPADDLPAIAAWLRLRIDWLSNQDWSAEIADNMAETYREALAMTRPPTTYRIEIGPCPELVGLEQRHCDGTIIAVMRRSTGENEALPSVVRCTVHGDDEDEPHSWGPMQWHTLGRRMGKAMHPDAAHALARLMAG
jgi:hypothetical protein